MHKVLDVIIIDDEPLARKKLESFIVRTPSLFLKGSYPDAKSALEAMSEMTGIFGIFSDVEMPNMSGVELVKAIKNRALPVVLTTAYEHYALVGYELDVVDYLLKPFSYDRFRQAVERMIKMVNLSQIHTNEPTRNLVVKAEHKQEIIPIDSILFIEGMKDYVRIHTPTRKIMTLMRMSVILEQLPEEQFARVHKSFIVNIDKVVTVSKDSIIIEENKIPIGRSFKDELMPRLGK